MMEQAIMFWGAFQGLIFFLHFFLRSSYTLFSQFVLFCGCGVFLASSAKCVRVGYIFNGLFIGCLLLPSLRGDIMMLLGFLFSCTYWMNILSSASIISIWGSLIYSYETSVAECFNASVNTWAARISFSAVDMKGNLALSDKSSIISKIRSDFVVVTYVL